MKKSWKPYELALIPSTTSTRKRLVQTISFPIPRSDGGENIMVRMTPNDPGTLREVGLETLTRPSYSPGRWMHVAEVRCDAFGLPEDMLRYDSAAIYDPDQPEEVEHPVYGYKMGFKPPTGTTVRIYTVRTARRDPWTHARWASFSASVKSIAIIDLSKQSPDDVERL
jgi:hypothetical protein